MVSIYIVYTWNGEAYTTGYVASSLSKAEEFCKYFSGEEYDKDGDIFIDKVLIDAQYRS